MIPPWLWQNLASSLIAALLGGALAIALQRLRPPFPRVRIDVRTVTGAEELARTRPHTLIVILGIFGRSAAPSLGDDEIDAALAAGDYERLALSRDTLSLGHTIRAIETYRASLERIYLITTEKSRRNVPLLRNYVAGKLGMKCEIVDDLRYSVSLEDDVQVTRTAYGVTRLIFADLREKKLYTPERSQVLVDVTGGVRAMQVGVLLACVARDQDIQLIGSKYDASGRPVAGEAFPMIIGFEPEPRGRA